MQAAVLLVESYLTENYQFRRNVLSGKTDDMEGILRLCYRLPEGEEQGEWLTCKEVCNVLSKQYPSMKVCNQTKIRIGQTLKYLGCTTKHTRYGAVYNLVSLAA